MSTGRTLCPVLAFCLFNVVQAEPLRKPLPWQDHDLPHVKKQHTIEIDSRRREYVIPMGGTVDMDCAMTRECGIWHIGWQPNESLVIENIGPVPCENAKVIANDRGDWYTLQSLLSEATASARSDQEKVYLLWDFCRSNRHHDDPIFVDAELHDPVKMLMTYGAGLCDDSGSFGAALFHAAGFSEPKPFVRALYGHMMCEVFAGNRWQFMDIDENVFYLDRENELPVGGDVVARDHDLAHREIHYGPIFGDWPTSHHTAALFGRDDQRCSILVSGHQIRVNLRPGERIEYRWDNVGKWARCKPEYQRRWVGNSRIEYAPPLSDLAASALRADHVSAVVVEGRPAVAAANAEGLLLYRMTSPYVFCGGRITADVSLRNPVDRAVIEAGADPGKLAPVWQAEGPGTKHADVEIDNALGVTGLPPKYEFYVRIRLISASGPAAAALTRLVIGGDIMVSPLALPRLRLGENKVVYTDDSPDRRKVRVTYSWRETTATNPLPAPVTLYPPDDKTIRDPVVTYKWRPVDGAADYHLQVSRDPAMRWPYRPSLDVVFKGAEYAVPFWGIYSPDTTYYWRIRTRNDKGIWGSWSKVCTFRWEGPRVPLNVRLIAGEDSYTLAWDPNPRGRRPVAYEIYGSDIRGFSINKQPHEIPTLDQVPGNYLGRTTANQIVFAGSVAVEKTPHGVERPENLNRCYYRVVAIDDNGTPSGCSDYAEMPHPLIWTTPVTTAQVGRPYRYQPQAIRDMGDLQHRYEKPENRFWEQENLSYSLLAGPSWLVIDVKTGLLTGTPPPGSTGTAPVRLRVTASFEKRTGKDTHAPDLPDRTTEQMFELKVNQ